MCEFQATKRKSEHNKYDKTLHNINVKSRDGGTVISHQDYSHLKQTHTKANSHI